MALAPLPVFRPVAALSLPGQGGIRLRSGLLPPPTDGQRPLAVPGKSGKFQSIFEAYIMRFDNLLGFWRQFFCHLDFVSYRSRCNPQFLCGIFRKRLFF